MNQARNRHVKTLYVATSYVTTSPYKAKAIVSYFLIFTSKYFYVTGLQRRYKTRADAGDADLVISK